MPHVSLWPPAGLVGEGWGGKAQAGWLAAWHPAAAAAAAPAAAAAVAAAPAAALPPPPPPPPHTHTHTACSHLPPVIPACPPATPTPEQLCDPHPAGGRPLARKRGGTRDCAQLDRRARRPHGSSSSSGSGGVGVGPGQRHSSDCRAICSQPHTTSRSHACLAQATWSPTAAGSTFG